MGGALFPHFPPEEEDALHERILQAVGAGMNQLLPPEFRTGIDPIAWTLSEWRMRCPRWQKRPPQFRRARRQFDEDFKALKTGCAFERRQLTHLLVSRR